MLCRRWRQIDRLVLSFDCRSSIDDIALIIKHSLKITNIGDGLTKVSAFDWDEPEGASNLIKEPELRRLRIKHTLADAWDATIYYYFDALFLRCTGWTATLPLSWKDQRSLAQALRIWTLLPPAYCLARLTRRWLFPSSTLKKLCTSQP